MGMTGPTTSTPMQFFSLQRLGTAQSRAPRIEYKNNIFISLKRLHCPKNGAWAVHFLVENFSLLGFEVQNWMLIVVALLAIFVFFVWRARD